MTSKFEIFAFLLKFCINPKTTVGQILVVQDLQIRAFRPYPYFLQVSKTLDYKPIIPDNEIDKMLYKYDTFEYIKGYIEIGEEKFVMPSRYVAIADEIENFEIRDTDIWIISRPKSGKEPTAAILV